MKTAIGILSTLSLLAAAGCVSPGTAEDFKWSAECPKSVDKGSEFNLVISATKESEEAENGLRAITGVECHYQIHWTGGSSLPLRHVARTGEPVKIRARVVPGPATILVTSLNREGLDVKVLETTIDVK